MPCVFCVDIKPEQKLHETTYFFVVLDINPIQQGHLLIISKKHRMNYRELSEEEFFDLNKLISKLVSIYEDCFHVGVTVIMNNGKQMDEGLHFHVHLLPRYHDDEFWNHVQPKQYVFDLEDVKKHIKNAWDCNEMKI